MSRKKNLYKVDPEKLKWNQERYEEKLKEIIHGCPDLTHDECVAMATRIENGHAEAHHRVVEMRRERRSMERWDLIKGLPRVLMGFGMYSSDPTIARDATVFTAQNALRDHQKMQQAQLQAMQGQSGAAATPPASQPQERLTDPEHFVGAWNLQKQGMTREEATAFHYRWNMAMRGRLRARNAGIPRDQWPPFPKTDAELLADHLQRQQAAQAAQEDERVKRIAQEMAKAMFDEAERRRANP